MIRLSPNGAEISAKRVNVRIEESELLLKASSRILKEVADRLEAKCHGAKAREKRSPERFIR